jgi:hypothetical protein
MKKTKLSLQEFVANADAMFAVSHIVIKPVIYRDANISEIVEEFNAVLVENNVPYEIAPAVGVVYHLRYQEERVDRALYILSCLTYENYTN